jgi:hypothetical protein
LLQCIHNKVSAHVAADSPTHNPAGMGSPRFQCNK